MTVSSLYMAYFVVHRRNTVLSPLEVPASNEPVTQAAMTSNTVTNRSHSHENVSTSEEKTFPTTSRLARTTVQSTLERDRLMAAAGAIKSNSVSSVFKHANDGYFHSSESNRLHDFSHFLINRDHVCSESGDSGKESPFLMVLVLSSYLPQAAEERQAIRATYGSVTTGQQWPGGKPLVAPVRMLFLLGSPPTSNDRQLVETESIQLRDILVADFVDTYQNLTLKVLHGLYWVVHNCPQAKFILKADDDVFVNLPLLTAFLSARGENNSLYGFAYTSSLVHRAGRWAVSKDVYPLPMYPRYMSGVAYVTSVDAAQKIVEASMKLPLVPIEDAFITGILTQITKARRMNTSGFTHYLQRKSNTCDFVRDTRFVGNNMNASEKTRFWGNLKSGHSC